MWIRRSKAEIETIEARRSPISGLGVFEVAMSFVLGPSPSAEVEAYICPACHIAQPFRIEGCKVCSAPLEPMAHWEWKSSDDGKNA